MRRSLEQTTTHVQELLGRLPSLEEMTEALLLGFCRRLHLKAVVERISSS